MVPFALREGTVFAADYRVEKPLARGGMGAVYVAEQLSTGKRRALKVMSPMLVDDAKARERFVQEAKVGGLVDSAHVVEVIAAGVDDATNMPWMAMELLEGETLQARIDRDGCIGPTELREIATQLRHALALAHERGIVHRDLKPENVFLERPRRAGVPFTVKILDFGIAKLVQQAKGRQASGTQSLGSPLWMAPEQANAKPITPATDVWSLGLLVFYAITGRVYWRTAADEGDLHFTKLLVEILVDPLVPGSRRAEELRARILPGAKFDAWLERCLSRDPAARFPEAGACLDALIEVLRQDDFRDTGKDLAAALGTARTAVLEEVDPERHTDPAAYEPVVTRAAPPTREQPREGRGMGMGQIAALLGGTMLAVGLAVFAGLMGLTAMSGEDDAVSVDRTLGPVGEAETIGPDVTGPEVPIVPPPPITITPFARADAHTDPEGPLGTPPPIEDPFGDPPDRPRPARVARTAAGMAFYRASVEGCWREELAQTAHGPTRMEIALTLSPDRLGVTNARLPARWQGTPFARCVIGRLPATRFTEPPERDRVVLVLPGNEP